MMTKDSRWTNSFFLFAGLLVCLFFPHEAAAQQFSDWSAPTNLNAPPCSAIVNLASNDQHPTISKDGLSLFFISDAQDSLGDFDIYVSHRDSVDACWKDRQHLGTNVNTPYREYAPYITDDGQWLYFHSNRPGGCGGQDLWVTHRGDTSNDFGWEPPVNLSCTINTNTPPVNLGWLGCPLIPKTPTLDQAGPTYFHDEASGTHFLYFTQRPTGASEDCFDIYVSTCTTDLATCNTPNVWGPGNLVDELSVPLDPLNPGFGRDTRTAIRRQDGLEMILSSKRLGGVGLIDLWSSTRPSVTLDQENWSVPINLTVVNSSANDGAPALSWDGTELYFYSDRIDLPGAAGGTDLYISKRTYITKTVLNSSANPSVFGQPVTFAATVSSAADTAPTGTVTFSDGATSLGTGTLASGQATFTTSSRSIGSHSITGQYGGDRISGASSGSLTQTVEYGVCPLFDQVRSVKSGATFPIKLQLCDANGNDLSSSAIVVHATSVTAVSGFSGTPDAPGNANPDNDFRFDATLGLTGGYIFNLSTGGLASGTYSLQFTAGSDPVTHSVSFGVK